MRAFSDTKIIWPTLATPVPSTARSEHYAWLGQFPELREWVGERVIQNLRAYSYTFDNRKFEATIRVKRDDIEDDSYGLFGPMFDDMGRLAATHPEKLIFELLSGDFKSACYDGLPFFNEKYPVCVNGKNGTASNYLPAKVGEESAPWFLLDTSRAIKPFIFQKRRDYALASVASQSDGKVFMSDEYLYGIDARVSVGFGFWQQAYGSNAELTADNFDAAYQAMASLSSDEGRPLGVKPTILLCGISNRKAAFNIAQADRLAENVPNPNYQIVDVVTTQYLA